MLSFEPEQSPVILSGDYEYLTEGYYACEEAEDAHTTPFPTCADVLDAYIVPIALERARIAGLPVPAWHLTNDDFEAPAVLYGVNPFARNHLVVRDSAERKGAAAKISRNGKFVMCCEQLPEDADLVAFDMAFGRTPDDRFAGWAADVYRVFRLPMAKVRLMTSQDGSWLSAIERLPKDDLSHDIRTILNEKTGWRESNG
jgi:hypothetical protein